MKKFLTVLVTLLILVSLVGCGTKKKTVGVIQLVQHEALDKATQGFVDVLKEAFGDEIVIDVKNASGDSATCATIASSFVADGYDLILGNATPALQAAAHATDKIPVLGTSITEYGVALDIDNFNGLVGGNVSGTSDLAPLSDQAQMIIDLFPSAKKVGLLYCSGEPNSVYQVKVVKEYLESKGLQTSLYAFADSNDVATIAKAACEESEVLYIPTDNTCASNGGIISAAATEANVPIIAGEESIMIACDAVASFSIDYYQLGRATGEMAVKILKGQAKVSEMKIEYYLTPEKKYIPSVATKYNVNIPSDYKAVNK